MRVTAPPPKVKGFLGIHGLLTLLNLMKSKQSSRKPRRHFKVDPLEPRLLLSASPALALAGLSMHVARTTAPSEPGAEGPAGIRPADLTLVSWTAGVSGDWGTASNWSNDAVPTSNDIVSIPAGLTVTISSGSQTANSIQSSGGLTISGGSLTLSADSSVTGAFNNSGTVHITGGTLVISAGGTSSGTFDVDSGAALDFDAGPAGATYTIADGSNWNGAGLYEITGFRTVTLADAGVSLSVQNLSMSGYTILNGAGNVTIPSGGTLNWQSGTIQGTGTFTVATGATWTSTGGNVSLDTCTFYNYGTATLTNTSVSFYNNATLDNGVSNSQPGVINVVTNAGGVAAFSGTGGFTNAGTLNVSQTGGSASVTVPLTNPSAGTLNVTAGTFTIGGGGSSSGAWDVSGGATLGLDRAFTFNTGAAWNGSGLYLINGPYNAGSVVVGLGLTLTPLNVQLTAQSPLEIDGALTIASTGLFTAGYDDNLTQITGTGTLTISQGATMQIGSGQGWLNITGTTIFNHGTMQFDADSTFSSVTLGLEGDATIFNEGTIEIQNNGGTPATNLSIGGFGYLNNFGSIYMQASGALTMELQLNNDGAFNISTGSVTLTNDGHAAGSSYGSFDVSSGATLTFDSSQSLSAAAAFNGSGAYALGNAAVLTLNSAAIDLSPLNFTLNGGTINGAGQFTVATGSTFAWKAGTIGNSGGFNVQPGVSIVALDSGFGSLTLNDTTLINAGTIAIGSDLTLTNSATLQNQATGVLNIQIPGIGVLSDDSTGKFTNAGVINVSADTTSQYDFTNIIIKTFSNTGTLNVESGTVDISGTPVQISPDKTTLTGGTWIVAPASTLTIFGIGSAQSTTVTTNDATVTLEGAGSTFNALDALTTNNGTLTLGAGATLSLPGDFTQTSGGALTLGISGTPGSGDFGSLAIAGTATLAGTLDLTLGSYLPAVGAAYTILTYNSLTGNFATEQNVTPTFSVSAGATSYLLNAGTTNLPEFSTGNITAPSTAVSGQNITVGYTVTNDGTADASGNWTDSIYLSPGTTFDPATAVLLGSVVHTGGLPMGSSYSGSITAVAPGLSPGNYSVIVVADSLDQITEQSRLTAAAASAGPVAFTVPTISVGTPFNGSIANGQTQLYELDLPGNSQVQLSLQTAFAAGAQVYVSYGSAPTTANYQETAFNVSGTTANIDLNAGNPGPYYILVVGRASSDGGASFTLSATQSGFAVTGLSPSSGTGVTTITLQGAQFSAGDTVKLIPDATGSPLSATHVYFTSGGTLAATFNLGGLAVGSTYDVQVSNGITNVTLPAAFTVGSTVSTANPILLTITSPANVRTGEDYSIQVNYANVSGEDQPAPLLLLSATNADLELPDSITYVAGTIAYLATNTGGGPAGILPAGYQGSVTVGVEQTVDEAHTVITYSATVADPSQPMNYDALVPYLDSANYSPSQWAAVWNQVQSMLGTTQAGYLQALDNAATLLPASLGSNTDPIQDMYLVLAQAQASITTSITGTISTTSPGLQLGGLFLTATDASGGNSFGTYVLNDGSFVLPNMVAGTYTLSLNGAILGAASAVPLNDGEQVTGVTLSASAGGTLLGTTNNASDGSILAGASIEALGANGEHFTVTSGANGQYQIPGLPPGTYTIIATASGVARVVDEGVSIGSGGQTLNLSFSPQSTIGGTIAPAANLTNGDAPTVSAQPVGSTDPNQIYTATPDSNGNFTLTNLPAGSYNLTVSLNGYFSSVVANVAVASGAAQSVGAVDLTEGSTISGVVTSTDSAALAAGQNIGAYQNGNLIASGIADANGNYTITGLAAGTYQIEPVSYAYFSNDPSITLIAGETSSGVSVEMQPGGVISGVLTQASGGQPLPGVAVYATNANGGIQVAYSDASGNYSFQHLAAGSYTLVTNLQSSATSANARVTTLDPTPVTANLQATISESISGTLYLADGSTPVSGAVVVLLNNGTEVATATSGASGTYQFLLEQTGTFTLQAAGGDASFAPIQNVVVGSGQNITENLTAGSGSLAITVTDASQSVNGDLVQIYQVANGMQVAQATLNASGQISIPNLVDGSYQVVVTGSNDRGAQTTAAISGGDTATPTIALQGEATITGTLTETGTGTPVAYGSIGIYSTTDSNTTFLISANANGTFSLPNLPVGSYNIVAFGPNDLAVTEQNVIINGSGGIFNFSLGASGTTLITGTIVDANDIPVAGATVTAVNSSNQVIGIAVTDSGGVFGIKSATGTNITLYVSKPQGLVVEVGELSEDPDQTMTVPQTVYAAFGDGINQAVASAISNVSGFIQSVNNGIQTILNPLYVIQPVIDELRAFSAIHLTNPAPPGPGACPATTQGYNDAAAAIAAENSAATDATIAQGQAIIEADAFPGVYAAELSTNVCTALSTAAAILGASPAALVAMANLGEDVTAVAIAGQLVGLGQAVLSLVSDVKTLSEAWAGAHLGDDLNQLFAGNFTAITSTLNDVVNIASNIEGALLSALSKLAPSKAVPGLTPAIAAGPLQGLLGVVIGFLNGGAAHLQFEDTQAELGKLVPALNNFLAKRDAYYQALDAANAAIASANNTGASHSGSAGGCGTGRGGGNAGGKSGGIGGRSLSLSGHDPNDIEGPAGYGAQGFVQGTQPLGYTINFENDPNASAPTAVVTVTETLDANVDISTFQLGNMGFGGITVSVPAGLTYYHTVVNDTAATGLYVAIQASLNVQTRAVTWTFTSIDPTTGQVPSDPLLGFLPPDVTAPEGLGFVSYTVSPVADLATGSIVSAQASVVFDENAPISTPLFTNTIDAAAPTSAITALAAHEAPSFTLQWSGSDDAGGSGLAYYDIYYSVNSGPYQALLLNTTRTAAVFNGIIGNTYSFYSIAVDNAGNTELAPAMPDVTTKIAQPSLTTVTAAKGYTFTDASGNLVTIKLAGPGSAVAMLEGGVPNDANLRSLTLSGTTTASSLSITVKKIGSSSGLTRVEEIVTSGANESINGIVLGAGVSLGSGLLDGSMALDVSGGVKSLSLSGLNPYADIQATGSIGALTLNLLNQTGAAVAIDNATLEAASFGNISVKLTGAATMTSGIAILDSTIQATSGNIGNITATVTSAAPSANLTAIAASDFSATGSIGLITASATGTARTPTGGSATAITNGDGSIDFTAGTSIAAIKATATGAGGANIALAGASGTPIDFSAGTSIGAVTLTASKSRKTGSTAFAAEDVNFAAGSSIGRVTIGGSATQAHADAFDITAGASIAGISITSTGSNANGSLVDSTILAGQKTNLTTNTSLTTAGIGFVTLSGSLIGSSSTPDSTIGAVGNIGAVTIGGNMTDESLVAGFNAGTDGVVFTSDDVYNRNASIASVTVAGMFDASSIIAGVSPGADEYWGGSTDAAGRAASGVTHSSKIGAIKLGAATLSTGVTVPFQTPATGIEHSAIESLSLTSIQIGKIKALTSFTASHWIDANGGAESASDTAIRIV